MPVAPNLVVCRSPRRSQSWRPEERLGGISSGTPRRDGELDGFLDANIGPATADVPVHRGGDLVVRRIGVARQKCRAAHDLPGLAIPALRNVDLLPRPLRRMIAVRRQALDGRDAAA